MALASGADTLLFYCVHVHSLARKTEIKLVHRMVLLWLIIRNFPRRKSTIERRDITKYASAALERGIVVFSRKTGEDKRMNKVCFYISETLSIKVIWATPKNLLFLGET